MTNFPDNRDYAIAVDIGATMTKMALVERGGSLRGISRCETPSSPESATATVITGIQKLLCANEFELCQLKGIGVSVAAFVSAAGLVVATAHLGADWVGFHLGQRLNRELPANYYFALDAPAPTLGEAYFGAGRGYSDFAYVTVSTGVGAGLVLNGEIYQGGLGWAGGIGHVIVDPDGDRVCSGCGNRGCLETYAATQGFLALAREAIEREPGSLLASIAGTEDLTPKQIGEAAAMGDCAANWVFAEAGKYLGLGLTSLVNVLSVNRIIIGGGVAMAGEMLLRPAREVVERTAFPPDHRKVEIVPAELGDLSGIYGVAAMVFNDIRINRETGA